MNSLRNGFQIRLFDDVHEDVSGIPDTIIQTPPRKKSDGVTSQEEPSLRAAVLQDGLRVPSEQQRRKTYQFGSLLLEPRKRSPDRWVYRYSKRIDGRKTRPKVILGTVLQYPTEAEALRASEHLRVQANAESVQAQVTMRGLIDLYIEKVLQPCLDVPIGGSQDVDAPMGYASARNYKYLLRRWISPRWEDCPVSSFEQPAICSEAEDWFKSLRRSAKNPPGLAPKFVRHIFAVMGQVLKFAVKRGHLSQNPIAKGLIDLPRGSTLRLTKAAELTPAQFFQLVPCLALCARVAVTFAAWLGPRGSEIFGLKWSDLDLNTGVVTFCRGFAGGRITPGKNQASRTEMPLPEEVVQLLKEWQSATPYNEPDDWVFASSAKKGKTPLDRFHLMGQHIQPVARKLGLPHISWYTFRHSLSAWGKGCSLSAEDRKILLRHATIASGEGYGDVPLEKKYEIAQRLWTHVRLAAKQNVGGLATSSSDPLTGMAEGRKAPLKIRPERAAKKAAAPAEDQPDPYLSHASKRRVA